MSLLCCKKSTNKQDVIGKDSICNELIQIDENCTNLFRDSEIVFLLDQPWDTSFLMKAIKNESDVLFVLKIIPPSEKRNLLAPVTINDMISIETKTVIFPISELEKITSKLFKRYEKLDRLNYFESSFDADFLYLRLKGKKVEIEFSIVSSDKVNNASYKTLIGDFMAIKKKIFNI